MIKIIKDGNKPTTERIVYQTMCNNCNCIFEFEIEDIKGRERHLDGAIFIDCPCCKKEVRKSPSKMFIRTEVVEK